MSTQYHVYGNSGGGGAIDYTTPLATVSGTTWSTPALAAGSSWRFGVRAFDTVSGREEQNVDASVNIVVSASGTDATNVPVPPLLVTPTPGLGGHASVRWAYPLAAARAPWKPAGFKVYIGTPTVSFTTPAATVAAATGLTSFAAGLTGLTAGATYQIVTRAYNAAGDDGNLSLAYLTMPAAGPSPVVGLAATATSSA